MAAGPIDAARWLGYIDWANITDERNLPPVIKQWIDWEPKAEINQGVLLPEIQTKVDLAPVLTEMYGKQPYHLVIFGEKSSLEPSLSDISNRSKTDLYLPTGEISDTMLYLMAKSGADDPRPMVVFCISDCDPSGWQMPISISRTLQAFKVTHFPDLNFRVYRVAITPWQVKNSLQHLQLPSSPLKEKETRADKWEQRMRVEQIEVDALVTLHPEVLPEMVIKAIQPFYDETLDERVQKAKDDWQAKAQAIIDEHTDQKALAKANQQLAKLHTHVESQIGKINSIKILDQEVEEIELPEIEMPEAEDNSAQAKDPLIASNWSFTNQCRRLIKSKQYRKLPKPEYDGD